MRGGLVLRSLGQSHTKDFAMKHLIKTAALAAFAGTLAFGGAASAQSWHNGHHDNGYHRGYDNQRYGGNHYRGYNGYRDYGHSYNRGYNRGYNGWHDRSDWRRGGYVSRYDYDRGYVVDWRYRRGLYRPPYGYEWRRVDDNYVLVAIASGLIASIISGY